MNGILCVFQLKDFMIVGWGLRRYLGICAMVSVMCLYGRPIPSASLYLLWINELF